MQRAGAFWAHNVNLRPGRRSLRALQSIPIRLQYPCRQPPPGHRLEGIQVLLDDQWEPGEEGSDQWNGITTAKLLND